MTRYTKPYLTVQQQIDLLEKRGMIVPDRQKAAEYLSRIGYYRLSAYWYPFRQTATAADGSVAFTDNFKPDSSFKTAVDLYAFDKALRTQLLDVLERIEVAVRTQIALQIGKYDPWAHRDLRLLNPRFAQPVPRPGRSDHAQWLQKLDEKARTSKEEFAAHFREKYMSSEMPIWIAVELLDFGPLSIFLSGLRRRDLADIAGHFNVSRPDIFASWIRSLSLIRNVCAHHARLWNRPLVNQPRMPSAGIISWLDHVTASPHGNRRLYAACAIARYLTLIVNPRTKWPERLRNHIKTFPNSPHATLASSGFFADWEQMPLWR